MKRTVSQRDQARPMPEYGSRRCRLGGGSSESERAPESGVAGWIALRRAHEGGVANLVGQWLDSGRRVPGYVADALDRFTSAGLLALGEVDPESCGAQRVTVTDTGSAQYVALCEIHNPRGRPAVRTPRRWAHGMAHADQVVINPCMQLPATSVDPVSGPGLELVASPVLQRVHGGG